MLQHQSGLPASFYFYQPDTAGPLYSQERDKTIRFLTQIPLEYKPGTKHVYSDIGYMLLGCIIENITGKTLDAYAEQELYKPLKLTHTLFNPLQKGFKEKAFAATERLGNTRDGVIHFLTSGRIHCRGKFTMKKHFTQWEGCRVTPGCFPELMIWPSFFKSC